MLILATTNTDVKSITGGQDMWIGVKNDCASGGSQFLTRGGVLFPSEIDVHSGQIAAKGPMKFAASEYGIFGISIVAGGTLEGATQIVMSSCRDLSMDGNLMVPYTEMVL